MLSVLRTMSNTPKKAWRATSKRGFPPRWQKAAGSPPPPAAAFPRRWPAEGGEGVPTQPRIPQGTTAPFALPPSKTTSGGSSFNACDENPHMILLRKCTDTGLRFFFSFLPLPSDGVRGSRRSLLPGLAGFTTAPILALLLLGLRWTTGSDMLILFCVRKNTLWCSVTRTGPLLNTLEQVHNRSEICKSASFSVSGK